MKHLLNGLLLAACLAAPASAAEHRHDHRHDAGAAPAAMRLNDGEKWPTDAPLRTAMANLRREMAKALPAIHGDRLPASAYGRLAQRVEREVGDIVAHCRLPADADAQLHVVVAELLAGAGQMAGTGEGGQKGGQRAGAVRVVGALDQYATHFADPGFKPLAH